MTYIVPLSAFFRSYLLSNIKGLNSQETKSPNYHNLSQQVTSKLNQLDTPTEIKYTNSMYQLGLQYTNCAVGVLHIITEGIA